ncbi:Oidioi.mRNA.OKI2018_I69.PAR.g10661.t1.cds [Oikopleura dioica]|uniref:Oidioi.mRNA.OKI2018_I69.PAR.g10661.t1.cds n=1 Tax=Oikopleura dioica TaxID=34765 RepID=A0ABN7RV87_OIKDI|nr:Oidioi.mRNA.OKI2018_I69.PAR.g10661.t1.cds [Oikopleura dioica]
MLYIDHEGLLTSCDYSNNSRYYAVTQDIKNEAIIYDARTDNKFDTIQLDSTPTCLEFSPNSQRIAIGTLQGEVMIWDVKARKFTLKFHEHSNAVSSICFDKDERMLVSGSWDKSIRMMDVSTGNYRRKGTLREQFAIAHHGSVASVRIYSRGQHMVSGGYDKRVMLWNLDHEMAQIPLQGHQDWVNTVEGNIEGTRVISGCKDGTIRYWNIEDIDKIPLVQNNKKDAGVRTELCIECARPFPVSTTNENLFTGKCVFCRIAERKQAERRMTYNPKVIRTKVDTKSGDAARRRTSFKPGMYGQDNQDNDVEIIPEEADELPARRRTSFRPSFQ